MSDNNFNVSPSLDLDLYRKNLDQFEIILSFLTASIHFYNDIPVSICHAVDSLNDLFQSGAIAVVYDPD